MNKILIQIPQETHYTSFTRAIHNSLPDRTLVTNLHNNLFDAFYNTKPDTVILPTNEYTQEFHDFISEYHKKIKIILFTNNIVANTQIITFWNQTNITIVSKKTLYPELQPSMLIGYDNLYDDYIYKKSKDTIRNDKIVVYLSHDDTKNQSMLDEILYPKTKEKLILFNSHTYKHPQNLGFTTPAENCHIFNSYRALIDIDDVYRLEASVCEIDNIDTEGSLIDNIAKNNIKQPILDYSSKSYNTFVKEVFLPQIGK